MKQLTKRRRAFNLNWPLALILLLNSCANVSAQGSRPQESKPKPTAQEQALDELARVVDRLQLEVESLKRKLALKDEQHANDLEAIRLRDEKIGLLDQQLVDAKGVIAELKLAGTADQNAIKAVKEELRLADKEIRALKLQNFLTGRLGILMIFAAAVLGFMLGQK